MGEAMKICKLMRTERIKRGLTLRQLSDKTGYSIASLHSWERGKRSPIMFHAECVLNALGYKLKVVKK